MLKVLLTVTVFILLLAVLNYVNLSTARASLRAKEVGARKVVGSSNRKLISQILVEAILITVLSFLIAIAMVQLLLPGFNQLASTDLDLELMRKPGAWMIVLISVIVLGLITGLYPAVYMTGFQPVVSLTGENESGSRLIFFRRVLLTFQFTISIVLIIGVLVIFRQLNYMKTANLGFNRELVINLNYNNLWAMDLLKRQLFRQQLLQNPGINGVAFSNGIMGEDDVKHNIPEGLKIGDIKKQISFISIDPDFFELMEIELPEGRNFSWERTGDYWGDNRGDQAGKVIFNQTAVREFELEKPVGTITEWANGLQLEIIGVVRDIHFWMRPIYSSIH